MHAVLQKVQLTAHDGNVENQTDDPLVTGRALLWLTTGRTGASLNPRYS